MIRAGRASEPYLLAHRASWVIHNGDIPDGLFVLHHCDNPKCVNPSHLYLGTAADNSNDRVKRGRSRLGRVPGEFAEDGNPNAKLTRAIVNEIRSRPELGRKKYAKLGREYGVHGNTIRAIALNRLWAYSTSTGHAFITSATR